tara:strand:- start:226 stop:576 length:351 start_codon:yes stop_codon:yes gene_type:complete
MKGYKMSDLEYNAFIEHCKETETYKKTKLYVYRSYPEDMFRATGEMAIEDEDNYYSSAHNADWDYSKGYNNGHCIETNYFKNGRYYEIIETKEVKVKGYNKNAPYKMSRKESNNEK